MENATPPPSPNKHHFRFHESLRHLAAPFGNVRFCPTGGISLDTAPGWLAEDFITCVGGSWIVPKGPLDVAAIENNARAAAQLAMK